MDAAAFEARLKAEGYPEIRTNGFEPNCHNAEHTHPFDVLAMVLQGDITLTVDGKARKYLAGEVFSLAAECPHVEDVGPSGVRYMVGRRPR